MGGLCSKEGVVEAPPAAPHPVAHLQKASSRSLKQLITLTAKEEDAVVVHAVISRMESNAKANGGIVAPAPGKEAVEKTAPPVVVIMSLSKSYSPVGAPTHHRCATVDIGGNNNSATADCGGGAQAQQVISSVPQGFSGEHVIVGWPSWLTSVAEEILEGIVTSHLSHGLYLVFEYMEHDLTGLAALSGQRFTEPQVKCFMRQILEGLRHCHARGVLHRYIKGSNLLKSSSATTVCSGSPTSGSPVATFFDPGKTQPLTSRVVTLWYRPSELLLGPTEYRVAVDLRSTGCILAELLAGKPIMPGQTEIEQLHRIFKLCGSLSEDYLATAAVPDYVTLFKPQRPYRRKIAETFKDFPPTALALLDTLLAIEPSARGTVAWTARTKPLPCDQASLPKYPRPARNTTPSSEARRPAGKTQRASEARALYPSVREETTPRAPRQLRTSPLRANQKSTSHHYSSLEDSVHGPIIRLLTVDVFSVPSFS
ncbi:unnamed protein product [Miscanthus lutarioriparius]|uniref:[RNA-polymerase]-subunit kinase n=1 Tax=Miscanthus lutarioriparius TaxID=422564 RepID=A0A811QFH9_9POAL|nr:unnamed protein product [Miscanthus lutarioriparius]